MNYHEARLFIENTKTYGSILGLDRVRRLLDYLGNPEKQLRFVHITGTNGKGSTAAYLAHILMAAGYKVGRFNSPFIQRFSEQIHLNHEEISDRDFADAATIVKSAYDRMMRDGFGSTTEFETIFAIALQYFLQKKCDIVILEVGMGGRGDATNVIPAPEAAVFAHIALDHSAFLGNTLEAIAEEKSGIIKAGCQVVTTRQTPEVLTILHSAYMQANNLLLRGFHANDLQTNAADPEKRFYISEPSSIRLLSSGLEGQTFLHPAISRPLTTSLSATYQLTNAALAIEVALALGKDQSRWQISEDAILQGIENTRWPGRFELLDVKGRACKPVAFLIDGAHNPDGIAALTESLSTYFPDRKLIMITGVLADKDYHEMLSHLLPFAKSFHCITVPNPRALPAENLAETLTDMGAKAMPHPTIGEAIESALSEAGDSEAILAFGSLYYIGKVRDYLS